MPGPTPTQPGWYPDGEGNQRWFDGNSWTDHVQPGPADDSTVVVPPSGPGTAELPQAGAYGAVPPPPPAAGWNQPGQQPYGQQPGRGKGLWIALAVLGVLLLIGIIVVGAFLLLGGDEDDDKGSDETTTSSTPDTSSTSPEDTPTEETDDLPSVPDSPTDLPTEFTDMPSEFPSDFPSELFSDFPTDPAEWESWFSEYLEQVEP